jgi:hypothetical protein
MLFKGKHITCEIKYQKEKYTFDLERHKTVNDLYNLFKEKIKDECPFLIIFIPNISNNKESYEINNLETTLISLEKDKNDILYFEFIKSYKCLSCLNFCDNEKKIINKYCIDCDMYICSDCSKGEKHAKHYLIDIDKNNLKDSVKLWNINLNAELSEYIRIFNNQIKFITEDLDTKIKIWLETLYKQIKGFENIINSIKIKTQELKYYFKESENILNKAMLNLTKSEQEINIEFFNEDKNYYLNKYISFDQAQTQIQKLKSNYKEMTNIKKDLYEIISAETIKKWEEMIYNVPKIFEEMPKIGNLVLNELNIYEMKNKKNNKKDNISQGRRKKPELYLGNNLLFKTANEVQIGILRKKNKNKNIYILQDSNNKFRNNDKKITDFSIKLKHVINLNENGDDGNDKADYTYRGIKELLDKKAYENEGMNNINNIKYLNKERNRYTPKNVKLPKIVINDKEKYIGKYFKSNYDDINKNTISSKK